MSSTDSASEKVSPEDPSLGRSSGPQVLTRTFHLTISTKDPVSEQCQQAIVTYVREKCIYSYIVTETGKSGKLHLHAVLVFEEHREKKKLQENICNRLVKKQGHPEAKNGIAVYVQVCPGHKWYDEYLRKEDGRTVLLDNYVKKKVTPYFPSKEEQEFLQTHHNQPIKDDKGPVDKHMAEHKRRWIEMMPDDSSYDSAICYLKTRMYVKEDMVIIQDKRRLNQMAYSLYEYRGKICVPDFEDLQHAGRMSGNYSRGDTGISFAPPVFKP